MKGVNALQEPSRKFNCIGYALLQSDLITGWRKDHPAGLDIPLGQVIVQEMVDVGILKQVTRADARAGDLAIYQPGYPDCAAKEFPHIGIVTSTKAGIRVKSKWGPGGKYEHALEQVPPSYLSNGKFQGSFYRIINRPD